MANHKSAKRRNRQRIRRTARNRSIKSAARTVLKKARTALAAGDAKTAEALVREVESSLDRGASKGVLHPRAASRVKARLHTQLSKLSKPAG
jgi:small subunit ribosomal protein S20